LKAILGLFGRPVAEAPSPFGRTGHLRGKNREIGWVGGALAVRKRSFSTSFFSQLAYTSRNKTGTDRCGRVSRFQWYAFEFQ
jgi:hypothetical protein